MPQPRLLASLALLLPLTQALPQSPNPQKSEAQLFFRTRVTPFITTYCLPCHQNRRPTRGGVNFSPALNAPGHAAFTERWHRAAARVKAHDMPPKSAPQPSDADRQMFAEWLTKLKYLSDKDPGTFVIHRLTKSEYANTLQDLFGVHPSIADPLPNEVSGQGYLNSLSSLQLEQYLSIADQVLRHLDAQPAARRSAIEKRIFGTTHSPNAAARTLARTLYRRPPTNAEIDVLIAAFNLGRTNQLNHAQSLHLMLKAALVSPQFLFITPAVTAPSSVPIAPLDPYQLASRLSYLLWGTMPDQTLMSLADTGKLQDPSVLAAQVQRLLNSPRSRALFDGFGAQWLGVGTLRQQVFDPSQFPQMTSLMRQAMYDEARLFFQGIVQNNDPVIRFVDANYTYLNATLAPLYGLQRSIQGPTMRKVVLTDRNRGGVLGMPGILAATSFPNRTSAVKRGVWVLEQVLGEHVPAAPPDVPALDKQDPSSIANLTLRQRTELHRTNPVCANCHQILDPIGFGLEKFDAIGRWREHDTNGQPIDTTGELPGGKRFTGPADLKAIIAERNRDVARNLVEKLLGYALGRKLEGYDEIVVDNLMDNLARDHFRMRDLISGVVTSYPFTHRRIEELSNQRKPNESN